MGRRIQGINRVPQWTELSKEEQEAYTMGGTIPVGEWYINDSSTEWACSKCAKTYKSNAGSIQGCICPICSGDVGESVDDTYQVTLPTEDTPKDTPLLSTMVENTPFYPKELVEVLRLKAKHRIVDDLMGLGSYSNTTSMLYACLEKYPIKGKRVAIIGSVSPWHEAICLEFGGIPTTIEYNKLSSDDSQLNLMTVEEYWSNPISFDAVFSISSYEHDGLGRYGDPIDPDGDLKSMQQVKSHILKKGGLLYLAVPVGWDVLHWNAHRIYGPKRWPLLIKGFEFLYSPSADFDEALRMTLPAREYYQPCVVLKNGL